LFIKDKIHFATRQKEKACKTKKKKWQDKFLFVLPLFFFCLVANSKKDMRVPLVFNNRSEC